MDQVINFYKANQEWIDKVIYLLVSILVAIVISVIKKKPIKVIDTVKECITRLLPYCICEAEQSDLKGENKKVFALQVLYKLLKEFGYEEVYDQYREYAAEHIEVILSTPQKKEVSIREK